MFIESFTGVTEKVDIQIQKGCRSIAVLTTGGVLSNSVLVSLKRVTSNGNEIMYDQIPANDLAEIMSQDEGLFVKDMANYTGSFPFVAARSIHMYPVGYGGALPLENNEYYSLDLRGLTGGTTYRVMAIESIDQDGLQWDIEKMAVAAPRNNQRWNVNGRKLLVLPKTNFDKVQLFPIDSNKDAIFTGEELGIMSFYENDVAAIAARNVATTPAVNVIDLIFGYDNVYLINVEGVAAFEVYCTGAAGYSFYLANATAQIGDPRIK